MKKLALISVSDKTGIVEFAGSLISAGYEIIATGKTLSLLRKSGIECISVEEYASFPEVFGGRVKTLQPRIFGGILFRRDEASDQQQAKENGISPIDIVCVNLYPFPEVVNNPEATQMEKIENIDIGGPSLIRAAAKNYRYVSILTDPGQYENFIQQLKQGTIDIEYQAKLAAAAFNHTAYYDSVISGFFNQEFQYKPERETFSLKRVSDLRYGENPHQNASVLGDFFNYFEILHGKELSYNNIVDLVAASNLLEEFSEPSCMIIKHNNPCGAASGIDLIEAYKKALACDPVSAFGGIAVFNGNVDLKLAESVHDLFLEVIVAPSYNKEALDLLMKKKQRRLLKKLKSINKNRTDEYRSVPGGFLKQNSDNSKLNRGTLKVVTVKTPDEKQLNDLEFAWRVCKHVRSNAIVYVKDKMAIGIGAGQMSRIDSVRIAAMKARNNGHEISGSVAASDAFFPFPDGIEEMASFGINAVIQPGGSVRDNEVIEAADKNSICMIFSGIRNFKH